MSNQHVFGPEVEASEPRAMRFNAGKPQLSFVLSAPEALKGLSKVFEAGAEKYSRDNWKLGLDTNELIDSAMRHLLAYANGDELDLDPETSRAENGYTGLPHVDQALWNLFVLAEQYRTFPGIRPRKHAGVVCGS